MATNDAGGSDAVLPASARLTSRRHLYAPVLWALLERGGAGGIVALQAQLAALVELSPRDLEAHATEPRLLRWQVALVHATCELRGLGALREVGPGRWVVTPKGAAIARELQLLSSAGEPIAREALRARLDALALDLEERFRVVRRAPA
jgi:hypothetical protein